MADVAAGASVLTLTQVIVSQPLDSAICAPCPASLCAMEASSITTAELLAVLRVVWPRVWELEASQDTPPLYIVQTYASYPCQCGSPIGICLSPHDACPNKSYGAFIVAQKTHLVTTDSDAAEQCARSALVELLQSECPHYRPTLSKRARRCLLGCTTSAGRCINTGTVQASPFSFGTSNQAWGEAKFGPKTSHKCSWPR